VNNPDEYLTVPEAAKWVRRTPRTIKRWMHLRLITVYRRNLDGALVVHAKELAQLERSQRQANVARNRAGRPRGGSC
jgi:hypothetical protein